MLSGIFHHTYTFDSISIQFTCLVLLSVFLFKLYVNSQSTFSSGSIFIYFCTNVSNEVDVQTTYIVQAMLSGPDLFC